MKRATVTSIIGFAIAIAIGFGLFPSIERSALCADCDADNLPGFKKAFEAFELNCHKQLPEGPTGKKACFASNVYNKVLPIMKALARDNRFGPGNRTLVVGETQNGDVMGGVHRSLQIVAPMDKDTLNIELDKTGGPGGALVRICSVDDAGTMQRIGTIRFDERDPADKRSISLNGVQGKMIRIDIAAVGASKKFQYTIRAT